MRIKHKIARPVLARGQFWRMGDGYIQIMQVGKRLVDYRMMKELGQPRVKTQMSGIDSMEAYLQKNDAMLVETGSTE